MKLKLRNILKVESADIELGGLTVITGVNDSGKSTVGKVLFSVLKSANNVRQVDKMEIIRVVRRQLFTIRRLLSRYDDNILLLQDLQALSVDLVEKNLPVESFVNFVEDEIRKYDLSSRLSVMLRNALSQIQQGISDLDNPEYAVKRLFDAITRSEFMEPLNSYGAQYSMIHFHDDTTGADGSDIKLEFNDGRLSGIDLSGIFSIEDITYIESPVYLHILNTLRASVFAPVESMNGISYPWQRRNIPYHLTDMAEKILTSSDDFLDLYGDDDNDLQLDEISGLIDGVFTLNEENKQLYFERDGNAVPTVSVASGIKSFGVLMRLMNTANISTSKMLVLDEPEIHLHPEWQIAFCKLIIELVAKGIPVVVSSHSPYFIQGLRYFAAAKDVEKEVKYYMARKNNQNGLSVFDDVTSDLNRVFTLLAAPLNDIMNVDAARNSLK